MGLQTVLVLTQLVVSSFFVAALLVSAQGDRGQFICPSYIYTFGDSLTDTGNLQAVIPATELKYPYGESYCFPDRPKERARFSNGRLVIDFITQAFRFPFIEPYLRHFDEEAYRRGVNFAISTGTATVTYSIPGTEFFLERETTDYFAFRADHTGPFYDSPSALHIIPEIGGNDFFYAYSTRGQTPETAIATVVPLILEAVIANMEQLYAAGARNIVVFNIPPEGCTSQFLTYFAGRGPYDEFGCLANYNEADEAYNVELKATIDEHREMWPDANLFYFDYYAATFEIVQNPEKYGFDREKLSRACCGCCGPYNFNPLVLCGEAGYIPDPDGGPDIFVKVDKACPDPDRHIIWDGQHSTQAFCRVVAEFFLTGQFVDGPRGFTNWKELCDLDFNQWYNNGDPRLCNNPFDNLPTPGSNNIGRGSPLHLPGTTEAAATNPPKNLSAQKADCTLQLLGHLRSHPSCSLHPNPFTFLHPHIISSHPPSDPPSKTTTLRHFKPFWSYFGATTKGRGAVQPETIDQQTDCRFFCTNFLHLVTRNGVRAVDHVSSVLQCPHILVC